MVDELHEMPMNSKGVDRMAAEGGNALCTGLVESSRSWSTNVVDPSFRNRVSKAGRNSIFRGARSTRSRGRWLCLAAVGSTCRGSGPTTGEPVRHGDVAKTSAPKVVVAGPRGPGAALKGRRVQGEPNVST